MRITINSAEKNLGFSYKKASYNIICVYLLALQEDIGIETDEEYGAVIPNS